MKPFFVRAAGTTVEVWSGYRVLFGDQARHDWQKVLKAELKEALSRLAIAAGAPFAGYYDTTDPRITDTENSQFTNLPESMPRGVALLRFERGTTAPPAPPVPIDLIAVTSTTTAIRSAGSGPSGSRTRHLHAGTASPADCQTMDLRDRSGSRFARPTRTGSSPSRGTVLSPARTSDFGLPCMPTTSAQATRSRTARC